VRATFLHAEQTTSTGVLRRNPNVVECKDALSQLVNGGTGKDYLSPSITAHNFTFQENNVKTFQRLCAASMLTLMLALPASAGWISTTVAPPRPISDANSGSSRYRNDCYTASRDR
jgi:hypothetical protein